MRHALFGVPEISSSQYASRSKTVKRRGFFASIIAALHYSRRCQARRILREYRHLIADPHQTSLRDSREHIGGNENAGE
jgi:hypothetical protein